MWSEVMSGRQAAVLLTNDDHGLTQPVPHHIVPRVRQFLGRASWHPGPQKNSLDLAFVLSGVKVRGGVDRAGRQRILGTQTRVFELAAHGSPRGFCTRAVVRTKRTGWAAGLDRTRSGVHSCVVLRLTCTDSTSGPSLSTSVMNQPIFEYLIHPGS